MKVLVQQADFHAGSELAALGASDPAVGGVACFVGRVRDMNDGSGVSALFLEHYPAMTTKAIENIVEKAGERWQVLDATVIHRVGQLRPLDQIVFVGVASGHRGDAFAACEFIMDFLKTRAPFWKKETTPEGERWVEARSTDDKAADRWKQ
ncbi:MAG: molybdopterin synthase catalytic subunit MoaE [Thiobacillaceae bacterium]|jgi:molybdopterin synthase catalytic subunit